MSFADHFSEKSALYAAARPTYPPALFDFIASVAPGRERAWDCATGNGQAAIGLARHFTRVDATDASTEQVANGRSHPRVFYAVGRAEEPSFGDRSFDAVCVAQALHWFDPASFHQQVQRVLKPGGLFASWGYVWLTVDAAFDAAFEREVLRPLDHLWPEQNRKLWSGYRDLPFPYEPVAAPEFAIEVPWTLEHLLDYVGTWSATRTLLRSQAAFIGTVRERLADAWGATAERTVRMPLHLVVGRHGRA